MALLTSELRRIRYELGYNVLNAGAEPYIGVHAVFEQVIALYTQAGAATTCVTAVAAATTPTIATLTLSDATGFSAGDSVVVDIDSLQERSTVQSITGNSIKVLLMNAHSPVFPVTVEGGEAIIRDILRKLYILSGPGGDLETASSTLGIKKVDEIEFFGDSSSGASAVLRDLKKMRNYWRDELASALGVPNLWNYKGGGGKTEFY